MLFRSYEAGASCASVSVPVFGSMECLSVATCCLSFLGLGLRAWGCSLGVRLCGLAGRFGWSCSVLGIRGVSVPLSRGSACSPFGAVGLLLTL